MRQWTWALGMVAALGTLASARGTEAQTRAGEARAWAHETSDVPVDPRIRFGRLDSGFRYAWMANAQPRRRSYLRLHVDVGSLAEAEGERGMAHFLEHMAFNGTRHFPAGALIEWFQRHGMKFGADTNALTAHGQTVYRIDLPQSDEKTLTEALTVLRDFADGILLEEEEVEAEKAVIDGEQREGDSAERRVLFGMLRQRHAGTLWADRLPIGVKEDRDRFTAASVRAFYRRWYRPEHMTLVIVGDLSTLDPAPLVARAFADMPVPEAPLVLPPPPGLLKEVDPAITVFEPEVPAVTLTLESLMPWADEPLDVATWTGGRGLKLARQMLDERLRALANKPDSPFLSARASVAIVPQVYRGERLLVTCLPEKWKEALALAEQELRRAIEHGFEAAELDAARAIALRGLDEAVAQEKTLPSVRFADTIVTAVEVHDVLPDAAAERQILRPALEALTAAKCQKDFAQAWAAGTMSLTLAGNLDLGPTGEARLTAAFEASRAVPVAAASTATSPETFAYAASAKEAGTLQKRKELKPLDAHLVHFTNGVRLAVKATTFQQNRIVMDVRLGEGRLTLDPADRAVGDIAEQALLHLGLLAHSKAEIDRMVTEKGVDLKFALGDEQFSFSGSASRESLLFLCELTAAYLHSPGWRDEGLAVARRQVTQQHAALAQGPQGPWTLKFWPAVHGDHPRFKVPTAEQVQAVSVESMKAWLAPHLASAPIAVTLVGDLDVEETVQAVARTFGRLPQRRDTLRFEERREGVPIRSGYREHAFIDSRLPKSQVSIVYPATDGMTAGRRTGFRLLEAVLDDRIRRHVREKLGVAYRPVVSVELSRLFRGEGYARITVTSDPDKVEAVVEACLATAHELAIQGATPDEVDRLRQPNDARARATARTNGLWLTLLSSAIQPQERHEDSVAPSARHSVETINALAAEYLKRERASVLIVSPKPSAPEASTSH